MRKETALHLLEQTIADYNAIAPLFHQHRPTEGLAHLRPLFQQTIQPGQHVLDVGCGSGRVADFITEIKAFVEGCDVSEHMVAIAKREHPGLHFQQCSMLALPYKDQSFDVVIALASLHHIPSRVLRRTALQELHRVLRPDGTVIITTWNIHAARFWNMRLRWMIKKILRQHKMDGNDVLIPWRSADGKILARRYYHDVTAHALRHETKGLFTATEQYYDTHGHRASWWSGRNLVSVLKKM